MKNIQSLMLRHKALFDAKPANYTCAFIDPCTWWLEVVIQEYSDGTLLCLSVYLQDVGSPILEGSYKLIYRCPDEGEYRSRMISFGEIPETYPDLKEEISEMGFAPALADTSNARGMLVFVQTIFQELADDVEFASELVPY